MTPQVFADRLNEMKLDIFVRVRNPNWIQIFIDKDNDTYPGVTAYKDMRCVYIQDDHSDRAGIWSLALDNRCGELPPMLDFSSPEEAIDGIVLWLKQYRMNK